MLFIIDFLFPSLFRKPLFVEHFLYSIQLQVYLRKCTSILCTFNLNGEVWMMIICWYYQPILLHVILSTANAVEN